MNWHADSELLASYVRGDLDGVVGSSVEQHLLGCGECRDRLADQQPVLALHSVWDRIREAAEAPRPTLIELAARRLGLRESDARLLCAAPSLAGAWLTALAAVLAFAVAAAVWGDDRGPALFLLVAPLAPVAGVAFAYGPEADPSHEVAAGTAYPAFRLLLLRTGAVLATALPLAALAAVLLPVPGWAAAGWLLPALAFTAVVLALATWIPSTVAAAAVAVAWAGAVGAAAAAWEPLAVVAPRMQLIYILLGLAGAGVFAARLRRADITGRLR
jgi:hypothetical protein